MLRFGYLLLRDGRWRERQVVPAEHVQACSRISPYNPHFPYSLGFDVNTDGHVPEYPRDAFWKSGSGGHVLYIVPSRDLVVWKLGGRDSQYQPSDTGASVEPRERGVPKPQQDWKAGIDQETAQQKVLQKVLDSITDGSNQ